MKEKMEITNKEKTVYEQRQSCDQPKAPTQNPVRKEEERISDIRAELGSIPGDLVAPLVNSEQEPQSKPKNKTIEIVKAMWERIKAAGKALFKPQNKEGYSVIP